MMSVLGDVREQLRTIGQLQQERARLTATASVRNKRVTVTVNADGVVIETKFSSDIDDLGYGEIARAVTEAAKQAAAEVARRGSELLAPLQDQRSRLPKLSDLIEDMPDFASQIPTPPTVPTSPPTGDDSTNSAAAQAEPDEGATPALEFSDVESHDHERKPAHGVTESSW
ncbi:YbaB/EbfC family nucleoid-associated protein [Nocardia uniformis]|uniref:YbaB/EbfC family nucleoid-associated protein n=2 Tax=Nocardia uniformis TaxID=53432 RepID=A0A849C2S0_9NOCA|nr:YbaB/EbfC family nucleoid-associated protein [Nocardia uniformis]